jgi:hypothetical protein
MTRAIPKILNNLEPPFFITILGLDEFIQKRPDRGYSVEKPWGTSGNKARGLGPGNPLWQVGSLVRNGHQ